MRAVFLIGWKNEGGDAVTSTYVIQYPPHSSLTLTQNNDRLDFNNEIHSSERFTSINMVEQKWAQYIGTSFEPEGEPFSGVDDSSEEDLMVVRRVQKKLKGDPTRAVIQEDGSIWIADIRGCSREELQVLVCGFLTAHYSKH